MTTDKANTAKETDTIARYIDEKRLQDLQNALEVVGVKLKKKRKEILALEDEEKSMIEQLINLLTESK